MQMRDASVCKDFLDVTFGSQNQENLEGCNTILTLESARGVLNIA